MPRANDLFTPRPGDIALFPTPDLSQIPTNLAPNDGGALSHVTGGRGFIPAPAGTGNIQDFFTNVFQQQPASQNALMPQQQQPFNFNGQQIPAMFNMPNMGGGGGTQQANSYFNWQPSPYLVPWAENPKPVNQLPAWQSMINAQERNVEQGAGQLNEFFNTMGGRFSTGYGTAMSDYFSQTKKDQNALLAGMEANALESALGRQFSAAGQLGNYDYGLESQRRGFGFASDMYNAQATDAAMNALASGSMYGTGQIYGTSNLAAQLLHGTENQALMNLFNTQNNAIPLSLQSYLSTLGMNLNTADMFSRNNLANLGLGSSMGGQQYGTLQDQIDRMYQEFIRTSPQYNPWVQMMQQMAMAQSNMWMPQYTPSIFGQLAQLGGQIAGAMIKP